MVSLPVAYEDDEVVILDKPSGLAVQGGERVTRCVDDLLAERYGKRAFLVHRLDKDTSGLLLVAKTKEAAARWSAAIGGKSVRKTYWAVCSGAPEPAAGSIADPVAPKGRSQEALTRYRTLASDGAYSLLELDLGTGRMHQLRIHLAGIGCPILGDDKYGDFALNKKERKERGLKKLLLHARALDLGPGAPAPGRFAAPAPEHFAPYLALLGFDPS